MKIVHLFWSVLLVILLFSCAKHPDVPAEIMQDYPNFFYFQAKNETEFDRTDAQMVLGITSIRNHNPDFNLGAFVIFNGAEEIPSQVIDWDGDGYSDQIMAVAKFAPKESKNFVLLYANESEKTRSYAKRTQAELSHKVGGEFKKNQKGRFEYVGGEFQNVDYLRVPQQHTDHSFFIRYEGPGWESDKVGYRFYLDWRNATDIFGKKVPEMVLQNVGLDGFDSYHNMSDWGMDILKVGDALGIGGIGMWFQDQVQRVSRTDSLTCRVAANGPVYSQIRTTYYGWEVAEGKYDLISDLSISVGSRLTRYTVQVSDDPPNLCTGIVKHEGVSVIQSPESDIEWGYTATYGLQSLAGDKLGMAVLYRKNDVLQITEDENNHVVVLKPTKGELNYHFLAAWEEEPGGITSESQFKDYLEEVSRGLTYPIKIVF